MALLFAVNGLIIGGYGGVLASIRDRLDLTATHIAILLVITGLAGIVAMPIGGRLSDAIGARLVALAGLLLLCVGIVGLAATMPKNDADLSPLIEKTTSGQKASR